MPATRQVERESFLTQGIVNEGTVVPYLQRLGLVDGSDGPVSITDLSSRNRVFEVVAPGGGHFIVKQAAFREDRPAIVREALMLSRLARAGSIGSPRIRALDAGAGVFVVDAIAAAEPLHRHLTGAGGLPASLAAAFGKALADVHELPAPGEAQASRPPRILSPHRPVPEDLRRLSTANLELLIALQRAEHLCSKLDELREGWSPQGLTHGDVRFENCLVIPAVGETRAPDLRLVDWERAGLGDFRTDLGAVAGAILWTWLDSMEMSGRLDAARATASAGVPIADMHAAARSFLSAYATARDLPAGRIASLAIDAVRFSATRLIEGAFERGAEAWRMEARQIFALQLAANALTAPRAAAQSLLGLAPRAG